MHNLPSPSNNISEIITSWEQTLSEIISSSENVKELKLLVIRRMRDFVPSQSYKRMHNPPASREQMDFVSTPLYILSEITSKCVECETVEIASNSRSQGNFHRKD
jgi:hypothetical protein